MVSMTLLMTVKRVRPAAGRGAETRSRPARPSNGSEPLLAAVAPERAVSAASALAGGGAAFAAALPPPLGDALVMPGQQHVGHAPAAVLGGPRVVGVLGIAVQRGA